MKRLVALVLVLAGGGASALVAAGAGAAPAATIGPGAQDQPASSPTPSPPITDPTALPGSTFKTCGPKGVELCGTVTVPLDYSEQVPGTVKLAVREIRAPKQPAAGTIFFAAGGPGEAETPLFLSETALFAKKLPQFNYLAIDQRGTGRSGALTCRGKAAACAERAGARRQFYRTEDSAADIEAVRKATGSGPLSMLGVSYGGRTLGEFARDYPDSTAALVLDSPVPLAGLNTLDLQKQAALPRVMADLCAGGGCRTFTRHPYGDLARLAARLAKRSRHVGYYDGHGRHHSGRLTLATLHDLVTLSDLNPLTRSELPAAVASALRGDDAPLARLVTEQAVTGAASGTSAQLLRTTACAESGFPWNPATAPGKGREMLLAAAVKKLGARPFAPWGPDVVVPTSLSGLCLDWPAVKPPPVLASVSAVPTLILTGLDDLRAPLELTRGIAAGYSGARVLEVPATGHSTLSSDESGCALRAAISWFKARTAARSCGTVARIPSTAPRAPLSLRHLRPRLAAGRRGRTVTGAELTVADLLRTLEAATGAFRQGGLHGGYLVAAGPHVRLVRYAYVPGLSLTGTLTISGTHIGGPLRIGGGAAEPGRARLKAGPKLVFAFASGARAAAARALTARLAPFSGRRPAPALP